MEVQKKSVTGEVKDREYIKGNWTLHETMILIEAKKMDVERRMKKQVSHEKKNGAIETRWKWIEDYCWKKGCNRSQNQCNDRWDNLTRDFKKVRDYELRLEEGHARSYWKLERHERKERKLPSNLLPEIYKGLIDLIEKKGSERISGDISNLGFTRETPLQILPPIKHHAQQQHCSDQAPPAPSPPRVQALPRLDLESEHSNSHAKRKRLREESSTGIISDELGSAISKSASILSETLMSCVEKEEKRHKDHLTVEGRKVKIEESKSEIIRKAINDLSDSINKLATSIHALAGKKNSNGPK